MVSKNTILAALPYRDQNRVITDDQSTSDIEAGILSRHAKFKKDYDQISDYFVTDDPYDTAALLWRFMRGAIPYRKESKDLQTVRSPYSIVAFPADCKSYALFAGGILDSLNRKGVFNVPYAFRFASYDENNWKEPGHVFLVLYPGEKDEIWIDPVPEISFFNEHLQPVAYKDEIFEPMALVEISGVSQSAAPADSIGILEDFRTALDQERRELLTSGTMGLNSPADLEYQEAIQVVSDQIGNGGIGVIDPGSVFAMGKDIISLFKKKKSAIDPSHASQQANASDVWNSITDRDGRQRGSGVTDAIKNGRSDVPAAAVLRWIELNGIQQVLNNTQYGPVSKSDVVNYFMAKGQPLSPDQLRKWGLSSAAAEVSVPGGSSSPGGGFSLVPILIGAGVLYFVMNNKPTRRRR